MRGKYDFNVGDHAWFMYKASICEGFVKSVTHDVPTEYGPVTMYEVEIVGSNTGLHINVVGKVPHVYMHMTKQGVLTTHFLMDTDV